MRAHLVFVFGNHRDLIKLNIKWFVLCSTANNIMKSYYANFIGFYDNRTEFGLTLLIDYIKLRSFRLIITLG